MATTCVNALMGAHLRMTVRLFLLDRHAVGAEIDAHALGLLAILIELIAEDDDDDQRAGDEVDDIIATHGPLHCGMLTSRRRKSEARERHRRCDFFDGTIRARRVPSAAPRLAEVRGSWPSFGALRTEVLDCFSDTIWKLFRGVSYLVISYLSRLITHVTTFRYLSGARKLSYNVKRHQKQ
jgi:hypothetical protein